MSQVSYVSHVFYIRARSGEGREYCVGGGVQILGTHGTRDDLGNLRARAAVDAAGRGSQARGELHGLAGWPPQLTFRKRDAFLAHELLQDVDVDTVTYMQKCAVLNSTLPASAEHLGVDVEIEV